MGESNYLTGLRPTTFAFAPWQSVIHEGTMFRCPACGEYSITVKHKILLIFKIEPICNSCASYLKPNSIGLWVASAVSAGLAVTCVILVILGSVFLWPLICFVLLFMPFLLVNLELSHRSGIARRLKRRKHRV
jgi:hypothetical protein